MAALPDQDRDRVTRGFSRLNTLVCQFTKADLRAAVNATDDWIDSNTTSFNTALPTAFRTNASLTQKTLLFCYVAMRRAGLFKVAEDG